MKRYRPNQQLPACALAKVKLAARCQRGREAGRQKRGEFPASIALGGKSPDVINKAMLDISVRCVGAIEHDDRAGRPFFIHVDWLPDDIRHLNLAECAWKHRIAKTARDHDQDCECTFTDLDFARHEAGPQPEFIYLLMKGEAFSTRELN